MKPIYWIVLVGVLVLIAIAYFVFDPFGGSPGASVLATKALGDPDKKERLAAVGGLGMLKDRNGKPDKTALPALKKVATETKDPEVKAFALTTIISFMDKDSLPIFFKALEDDDRMVRKAAHDGLLAYFSNRLPNGMIYNPDAPPAERADIAKKLQAEFDKPVQMP